MDSFKSTNQTVGHCWWPSRTACNLSRGVVFQLRLAPDVLIITGVMII